VAGVYNLLPPVAQTPIVAPKRSLRRRLEHGVLP
jgi:hypothetical protein